MTEQFQANENAWEFSRRSRLRLPAGGDLWVVSAKREETRARRLATLIDDSAQHRRIGLLSGRGG